MEQLLRQPDPSVAAVSRTCNEMMRALPLALLGWVSAPVRVRVVAHWVAHGWIAGISILLEDAEDLEWAAADSDLVRQAEAVERWLRLVARWNQERQRERREPLRRRGLEVCGLFDVLDGRRWPHVELIDAEPDYATEMAGRA